MERRKCTHCGEVVNGPQHYCRVKNQSFNSGIDDSFLLSAAIGAATDSAVLGSLIGGDIVGGIVGDLLDGDLFD